MTDTVLFDPGMGEYVLDFNTFINDIYSKLMSLCTINQKRSAFKLYLPKIQKYMKNNIAFYLGCLLWAYYISTENCKNTKNISGNVFYSLSEEEKNEFDYTIQVSFLNDYFDSFERDTLYYAGKKIFIPDRWKNILNIYSEFLELNKGFVNAKTTDDIILPEKLLNLKIDIDINNIIQTAIKEKNLDLILNCDVLD